MHNMKRVLTVLAIAFCATAGLFGTVKSLDSIEESDISSGYIYAGKIIEDIKVQGNVNNSDAEVKGMFFLAKGDKLDLKALNDTLKEFLSGGLFENVAIDAELTERDTVILTILVDEQPEVRYISYAGNEEKTDEELRTMISSYLKEGEVFSKAKLNDAKEAISASYRGDGYLMASVHDNIIYDEETESVEIELNIEEGHEIKVKEINIHGNTKYSEREIERVMNTQEDNFFNAGTFTEAKFAEDKQLIEKFYKDRGYYYASFKGSEISYRWKDPQRKKTKYMYIDIYIEEGERYQFGDISLDGNHLLSDASIKRDFMAYKGNLYNYENFVHDYQFLQMKYSEKGYIFSRIDPQINVDETNNLIHIHYDIYEGEKAHIETISIQGNTKTKDHVIRRLIKVKEGEIFNAMKVQRSQERIHGTQYFKDVQLDAKPGSTEGLMDLIFKVQEGQTGMISAGGGYGSASGFSLFAELKDINFLGLGQSYNFRAEYGQTKKTFSISWAEPWFLNNPIYLGAELAANKMQYEQESMISSNSNNIEYSKYSKTSFDTSVRLGYYFLDHYSTYLSYQMSVRRYSQSVEEGADIDSGPQYMDSDDLAEDMTEKFTRNNNENSGWRTPWDDTHILTFRFGRDSRLNSVDPLSGSDFDISASIYAGYTKMSKFLVKGSKLFTIPYSRKYKTALVLYGEYGFILPNPFSGEIENESTALYSMSMIEDVRGWSGAQYAYFKKNRRLNPYQSDSGGYASYGRDRVKLSMEYRWPIVRNAVGMVMFLDAGQTWYPHFDDTYFPSMDDERGVFNFQNYVFSTGFGVRVMIPVFPIRVYMAKRFVYNTEEYAKAYNLEQGFTSYEGDINNYLFDIEADFFKGWELVLSMYQFF